MKTTELNTSVAALQAAVDANTAKLNDLINNSTPDADVTAAIGLIDQATAKLNGS